MDSVTRQNLYGWFAPNQEVYTFTSGYLHAAKMANSRMLIEIDQLKADGAVGVVVNPGEEVIEYELNDTKYTDLMLNYVVLGTAVSAHPEKEQKHAAPLMMLDLQTKTYRDFGSSASADGNYYEMAGQSLVDDD
jgi:hypothetical protein